MVFCTACGHRFTGGERFCGHCGAAVVAPAGHEDTLSVSASDDRTSPLREAPAATGAAAGPSSPDHPTPDHPTPDHPTPAPTQPAPTPAHPTPTQPTPTPDRPRNDHPAQDQPTDDQTATGSVAADPAGAPPDRQPTARWAPGAGPIPLPPRGRVVRRMLLALGLPAVMVAAGLVGLLVLIALLQSGGDTSNAAPRVVTPPKPFPASRTTEPLTGPGTAGATGVTPMPQPPTSSTPKVTATTALQQAHAVEVLLDAAARTPVEATVASLARCDTTSVDASTAATTLQASADRRTELLGQLQDLPVDRLPGGPGLRAALKETWIQWQAADQQYLTWAQNIASRPDDCNPQSPFKNAGDVAAGAARRAGTQFVATWNTRVAGPLHLRQRQVRDL
jgi:hypothetical protein